MKALISAIVAGLIVSAVTLPVSYLSPIIAAGIALGTAAIILLLWKFRHSLPNRLMGFTALVVNKLSMFMRKTFGIEAVNQRITASEQNLRDDIENLLKLVVEEIDKLEKRVMKLEEMPSNPDDLPPDDQDL